MRCLLSLHLYVFHIRQWVLAPCSIQGGLGDLDLDDLASDLTQHVPLCVVSHVVVQKFLCKMILSVLMVTLVRGGGLIKCSSWSVWATATVREMLRLCCVELFQM